MNFKLRVRTWIVIIFVLLVLPWVIWIFLNYIPFYLPSYIVWGGILIIGGGCIGVIYPVKRIWLKTRKHSALIALSGLVLVVITLLWPSSVTVSIREHQRIDDFLPQFQCSEYHQEIVSVPAKKIVAAAPNVCLSDIPAAVLLLQVRTWAGGKTYQPDPEATPILHFKPGSGFLVLDDSNPYELVYGVVGRPWTNDAPPDVRTAEQFKAFNPPGHIKVAFNIRTVDQGSGNTLISTETRILGNDKQAQTHFARYWRVIYPGSSIIRRVWLSAIIRKAEKPDQ